LGYFNEELRKELHLLYTKQTTKPGETKRPKHARRAEERTALTVYTISILANKAEYSGDSRSVSFLQQ
jgi:hypothetical protein